MILSPDIADIEAHLNAGRGTIVRTTLIADLDTPVAVYSKLRRAYSGPAFLLESVEGGETRGRYSMIGVAPDLIWRCQNGVASLAQQGGDETVDTRGPMDSLRALIAQSSLELSDDLPPMSAGVFGYLGYDMVRYMEHLPDQNPDALGVPDAVMIRPTIIAVFDTVRDELSVITPIRPRQGASAKMLYEEAAERIEAVVAALEAPLPVDESPPVNMAEIEQRSNTSKADYIAMVERAKEYVRAGDVFQVVLSQRFESEFKLPAFALYRSLRRVNPSPFLCYLDFVDFQIVCSSPEILVRVRDERITIRPLAGTRPRGSTPALDKALGEELLADPKERSEHLMLLDLGRNDVGRVASMSSVEVKDSFFLERYSHVMHIVSHVEGHLDPKHDILDALAAGFPAGTVSGAPKVRAMEIIDELERDKRGPYAGCIGYFGANGQMDTCIVLRTAVVKDGRMHVQAGAGIVYDSNPESEYAECVNKARAMFRAAEESQRFATRVRRGQ
jgi:anthranilate synthase component I